MSQIDNWYKAGLEVYNRRTNSDLLLLDFFASKPDQFKLDSRKRCLSIGAGTGDVDVPFITSHCKHLTHYIGVEPNQAESIVLEERIKSNMNNPKLQVRIITDTIESWEGPDNPVDVILLVHVLYHIPDPKLLFQRCCDWLSPGGVLIIVHGGQNIFASVAEKFNVIEEKHHGKRRYDDLVELGFKNLSREAIYTEFDIRDRDTDLMNFLLQKRANEKELADLDAFLTETLPSGIEQNHDAWVIWWTKE